jgi:hypothetical protein
MSLRPRTFRTLPWHTLATVGALATIGSAAFSTTPGELSGSYTAQAGAPAQPGRGQQFFTAVHGRDWSCSSCHGAEPTQGGRHAATGKPIAPLAPAANPQRFTDAAKAEKWFRRNCNDVLKRECTAAEKADVLAWLMTLEP